MVSSFYCNLFFLLIYCGTNLASAFYQRFTFNQIGIGSMNGYFEAQSNWKFLDTYHLWYFLELDFFFLFHVVLSSKSTTFSPISKSIILLWLLWVFSCTCKTSSSPSSFGLSGLPTSLICLASCESRNFGWCCNDVTSSLNRDDEICWCSPPNYDDKFFLFVCLSWLSPHSVILPFFLFEIFNHIKDAKKILNLIMRKEGHKLKYTLVTITNNK